MSARSLNMAAEKTEAIIQMTHNCYSHGCNLLFYGSLKSISSHYYGLDSELDYEKKDTGPKAHAQIRCENQPRFTYQLSSSFNGSLGSISSHFFSLDGELDCEREDRYPIEITRPTRIWRATLLRKRVVFIV